MTSGERQTVEFIREFRVREGAASVRVFPAGWKGEVGEEIAAAAGRAGVLRDAPAPAGAPQDEGNALSARRPEGKREKGKGNIRPLPNP